MSTSTASTIVSSSITQLQDYFSTALPIIVPTVIAVAILFGGIAVLKRLWHHRV